MMSAVGRLAMFAGVAAALFMMHSSYEESSVVGVLFWGFLLLFCRAELEALYRAERRL